MSGGLKELDFQVHLLGASQPAFRRASQRPVHHGVFQGSLSVIDGDGSDVPRMQMSCELLGMQMQFPDDVTTLNVFLVIKDTFVFCSLKEKRMKILFVCTRKRKQVLR